LGVCPWVKYNNLGPSDTALQHANAAPSIGQSLAAYAAAQYIGRGPVEVVFNLKLSLAFIRACFDPERSADAQKAAGVSAPAAHLIKDGLAV
jgi:hypothetical protein